MVAPPVVRPSFPSSRPCSCTGRARRLLASPRRTTRAGRPRASQQPDARHRSPLLDTQPDRLLFSPCPSHRLPPASDRYPIQVRFPPRRAVDFCGRARRANEEASEASMPEPAPPSACRAHVLLARRALAGQGARSRPGSFSIRPSPRRGSSLGSSGLLALPARPSFPRTSPADARPPSPLYPASALPSARVDTSSSRAAPARSSTCRPPRPASTDTPRST